MDIDRFEQFALQVAKEDEEKMTKYDAWIEWVSPLFLAHTGYKYSHSHAFLYRDSWKQWLDGKRTEFDAQYKR